MGADLRKLRGIEHDAGDVYESWWLPLAVWTFAVASLAVALYAHEWLLAVIAVGLLVASGRALVAKCLRGHAHQTHAERQLW